VLEVRIARQEGRRPRRPRAIHVELLTDSGVCRALGRDGEPVRMPVGDHAL
jgi:hypothetical protein